MDPVIPPEIAPEAILAFSPLVMVPLVAGVVQVATHSGMPTRFASLLALVLGVVLGVMAALTTEAAPLIGLIQGASMGLGAAGLWMLKSPKIDTNGDPE